MQYSANRRKALFYVAFLFILVFALALRLPKLAQRPMHTDEAVHAIKFGQLLEHHSYEYDPHEYHGPTLVYSTLIPAWLLGQKTLAQADERTLRIVPVFFGMALIFVLLFTTKFLNRTVILFSALFTALSPAFVFFSRYYIMEMLLVFFTFSAMLAGYRFIQTQKLLWAIGAGLSLGLMHAAKETCILAWLAMLAAILVTLLISPKNTKAWLESIKWRYILAGCLAGLIASALFFSSFGQNPRGILDSILTYKTYIDRGAGGFATHLYPWPHYFKWLLLTKAQGRPLWTEAVIIVLSVVGFLAIFTKKTGNSSSAPFLRFLAFYTFALTGIYALIPYKTPWSLLGFYHGLIIMAAVGATSLFLLARFKFAKIFLVLLLGVAIIHLGWQSFQLNFKYEADDSNPYVYAHTDKDFFKLVESIENITSCWPDGKNTYIEIVCPDSDYWPLPWYLRTYSQVGYFQKFDFTMPTGALIITMPPYEADLLKKLYEIPPPGQRDMYVPQFSHGLWLRTGVEIDLYVRKDVWDEWQRQSP